jgi:hypothetical protein
VPQRGQGYICAELNPVIVGKVPRSFSPWSLTLLTYYYYLFILTANGFLPGGSGATIKHNKQITHITQNNTMIKRNTAHAALRRIFLKHISKLS